MRVRVLWTAMPWSAHSLPLVSLALLLMMGASTASAQRGATLTPPASPGPSEPPDGAPAPDPEVERVARELF